MNKLTNKNREKSHQSLLAPHKFQCDNRVAFLCHVMAKDPVKGLDEHASPCSSHNMIPRQIINMVLWQYFWFPSLYHWGICGRNVSF